MTAWLDTQLLACKPDTSKLSVSRTVCVPNAARMQPFGYRFVVWGKLLRPGFVRSHGSGDVRRSTPWCLTAAGTAARQMAFLDTKLLGKPPNLHGKQGEYADWAYITRGYVCLLDPQMGDVLTRAEDMSADRVKAGELSLAQLPPAHLQVAGTLHHCLTMLCRDRALRVVQATEAGNGVFTWRRLRDEIQPRIESRYLGMIRRIASWTSTAERDSEVLAEVQEWEREKLEYEAQSNERLPDSIVKAVLVQGLPARIRDRLGGALERAQSFS